MRTIVIAVALVFCVSISREAAAQSFWYVPPGYEYGYYYGLDAGNGVGFGYGIGVGVPLSANTLNTSVTPAAIPIQQPYAAATVTSPNSVSATPIKPVASAKKPQPKKAAAMFPKQQGPLAQQAKSN